MKLLRALLLVMVTALLAAVPAMAAGPDPVSGGPDAPLGGPDAPPVVSQPTVKPSVAKPDPPRVTPTPIPQARPDPPTVTPRTPLGPPTPPPSSSTPSQPSGGSSGRSNTPSGPTTLTPAQIAAQQAQALAQQQAAAVAAGRAAEALQAAQQRAAAARARQIVRQSQPGLDAALEELRNATQNVDTATSDSRRDLLLSDGSGSSGRTTLYLVIGMMLGCCVIAWFGRGLWSGTAQVSGRAAVWTRTSQVGALAVLGFIWLALIWRLTFQG